MVRIKTQVLAIAFLFADGLARSGAAGVESAKAPFCWTLSASQNDPFVNTLAPGGGSFIYLWLVRAGFGIPPCVDGLSTAQFGLTPSQGGPIIHATIPMNGFSNSGTATCLELAVSGCPTGPVVAASIVVSALPGNICFEPCDNSEPPEPRMGGEGCGEPGFYPMEWIGLNLGGGPCGTWSACGSIYDSPGACCLPNGSCVQVNRLCECLNLGGDHQGAFSSCEDQDCDVVPVEPVTWGRTKVLYRH